eukprot:Sspe_Gene.40106::Locus_19344_Transcript_1_1_Confidence_1.000_Length_2813::g.40106::m.40106
MGNITSGPSHRTAVALLTRFRSLDDEGKGVLDLARLSALLEQFRDLPEVSSELVDDIQSWLYAHMTDHGRVSLPTYEIVQTWQVGKLLRALEESPCELLSSCPGTGVARYSRLRDSALHVLESKHETRLAGVYFRKWTSWVVSTRIATSCQEVTIRRMPDEPLGLAFDSLAVLIDVERNTVAAHHGVERLIGRRLRRVNNTIVDGLNDAKKLLRTMDEVSLLFGPVESEGGYCDDQQNGGAEAYGDTAKEPDTTLPVMRSLSAGSRGSDVVILDPLQPNPILDIEKPRPQSHNLQGWDGGEDSLAGTTKSLVANTSFAFDQSAKAMAELRERIDRGFQNEPASVLTTTSSTSSFLDESSRPHGLGSSSSMGHDDQPSFGSTTESHNPHRRRATSHPPPAPAAAMQKSKSCPPAPHRLPPRPLRDVRAPLQRPPSRNEAVAIARRRAAAQKALLEPSIPPPRPQGQLLYRETRSSKLRKTVGSVLPKNRRLNILQAWMDDNAQKPEYARSISTVYGRCGPKNVPPQPPAHLVRKAQPQQPPQKPQSFSPPNNGLGGTNKSEISQRTSMGSLRSRTPPRSPAHSTPGDRYSITSAKGLVLGEPTQTWVRGIKQPSPVGSPFASHRDSVSTKSFEPPKVSALNLAAINNSLMSM